jgi:hypothetical protein
MLTNGQDVDQDTPGRMNGAVTHPAVLLSATEYQETRGHARHYLSAKKLHFLLDCCADFNEKFAAVLRAMRLMVGPSLNSIDQ